jgi:RNA recognition motif-containing protein
VSRKVYVGNLPVFATAATLTAKLREHGHVISVKMITDRQTGRSLGFAYVEMATAEDAERVIGALDGSHYDGWEIRVATATRDQKAMRRDFPVLKPTRH